MIELSRMYVGGVTHVVHGRKRRMAIDPHMPTTPGRRTSGFHRQGTKREAKREVWGDEPIEREDTMAAARCAVGRKNASMQ